MFWKKHTAWQKRVYADAAAATPLSRRARRELMHLLSLYGNPGALHKEAVLAKRELESARASVAASVGAHSDEIVFTASGTEANNLAIQGLLRPLLVERGEAHALTSVIEHQSVLVPLHAMEREGLYVTELPVNREGLVAPESAAEAVNEQTAMISIQLVNSEAGIVQPIKEIAKIFRKSNNKIYFHTDASQAPLWMDIKVDKLGVDLMTLDAQKVLGPKGVGCLYIRRGTPVEPLLWGGGQERGLRGGTENVPLAAAFAAALEDAQSGAEERAQKVAAVRDFLWSEIKKLLPDAVLHGPQPDPADRSKSALRGASPSLTLFSPVRRICNNLSISILGLDGEMAVIAMDAEGVAVSTRSACSTGQEEPSHVLKALGVSDKLAKEAIRITLLPDATLAEARRIARALTDIATRYRSTNK